MTVTPSPATIGDFDPNLDSHVPQPDDETGPPMLSFPTMDPDDRFEVVHPSNCDHPQQWFTRIVHDLDKLGWAFCLQCGQIGRILRYDKTKHSAVVSWYVVKPRLQVQKVADESS